MTPNATATATHPKLTRVCIHASRVALTACLCISALAALRCSDDSKVPHRPRVEINGRSWRVETATTRTARWQGLSRRTFLDADSGMLFIYPTPEVLDFCMRDCEIPLDIAFINADLEIIRIHTMDVEPDRLGSTPYSSDTPAQYALEVPAGALARANVAVGHKVTFSGPMPNPDLVEPSE